MRYREIHPIPPLARFVECYWTLESDASAAAVQPERLLPDGCVELILNFGEHFREHKDDGQKERQPRHLLVGQMTRPILIAPTGSVQLLGVRFHPGGTFPFFRVPMHELTNQVTELAALTSEFQRELIRCVEGAPCLLLKVAAVERLLAERVRHCKHDSWLVDLATRIVQRGGQASVDQLATNAGISSRQLERRFLTEVGISPKLLCRILRFQQIFRAFDRNDESWAAVAADCGYYDQAHLIRDFREFARQTPATLFERSSTLTESFTRKNRVSHFSNTPA
ncbi:MAG: AraC family transcriptional regulator [Pyrinomonadaceae bacterium]